MIAMQTCGFRCTKVRKVEKKCKWTMFALTVIVVIVQNISSTEKLPELSIMIFMNCVQSLNLQGLDYFESVE